MNKITDTAKMSTDNPVVRYLISRDQWFLCKLSKDSGSRNGIRKRFYGVNPDGTVNPRTTNSLEGCQSFDTVSKLTANSRVLTYYIADNDRIIGIDVDDINPDFDFSLFPIPFVYEEVFIEYSPSMRGVHLYCLVTDEVKRQYRAACDNKCIVKEELPKYQGGHVEYRICNCCLTFTGIPYKYKPDTHDASAASDTSAASVIADCCHVSSEFSRLYSEGLREDECPQGISEYVFGMAKIIYQRTKSRDPKLYFDVLSTSALILRSNKWFSNSTVRGKLSVWLSYKNNLEAVYKAVDDPNSSNGVLRSTSVVASPSNNTVNTVLTDITPDECATESGAPLSTIVDPKTPDVLLIPLFAQAYPDLYVTANGWYRYIPSKSLYINYTSETDEVLPLAEMFYGNLVPSKTAAQTERLSRAALRYIKSRATQTSSLSNVVFRERSWKPLPSGASDPRSLSGHEYIHCNDCIYNLDTGEFEEESVSFLSTSKLSVTRHEIEHPRPYDGSHWKAFLESSFNHDAATIESVQRFFGYVLSSDFDKQKALILRGEAGSGKGTLLAAITSVFNTAVASSSLQQLEEKFGFSACINKSLLVLPELPKNMRKYSNAWERIKQLASADPVSVECKGKQQYSTLLPCKVVICTNYDISYDGDMESLNRRFIYCTLPQSFGGDKTLEVDYKSLLRHEHDIIFKWVVDGYKLYKKYGLSESETGLQAKRAAGEETDTVRAFIAECLVPGDLTIDYVTNNELKNAYNSYCDRTDVPVQFRAARTVAGKVKTVVAKEWFHCPTTALDYRHTTERGIKGVRFSDSEVPF